jgi:hypothetical protein
MSMQLKALEAADVARRKEVERQAERQRQKADLERQRQERLKVPSCWSFMATAPADHTTWPLFDRSSPHVHATPQL